VLRNEAPAIAVIPYQLLALTTDFIKVTDEDGGSSGMINR
jgi:hypothetical protein